MPFDNASATRWGVTLSEKGTFKMRLIFCGAALLAAACSSTPTPAGDASPGISDASASDSALADASVNDLTFYADPSVRVDNASNAKAGVAADGSVYLYYQERNTGKQVRSVSTDGLTFAAGAAYTTYENHPSRIQLASGKWLRYILDPKTGIMTSASSTDGITFTAESGIRYQPATEDKGSTGIYDHFVSGTSVVMLYLGDLMGKNNTRMALSTDNGASFTFQGTNVLGDDNAGGGANAFVDISSIALPSGGRRLFAMRGGQGVYSFANPDPSNRLGWVQDPGARVERTSWGDATITGVFDPTVVRLKDGRYRMYVTVGYGTSHEALVSATTK